MSASNKLPVMASTGVMTTAQTATFRTWLKARLVNGTITNTTLLATSRPEGRDLIGLDEPEDEILKQPGENLPVHGGKGRAC